MLPTTTSALLSSLLDEDPQRADGTWAEFDARCRPVLRGFARRLALGEEDARDLAQDVLVTFVEEYRAGRYDHARGRLRSWLFAIARARVARYKRGQHRAAIARGESMLATLPDEDRLGELWDQEWRRAILREGLRHLRSSSRLEEGTLAVFEALVLEGRAPEEVAAERGLSTASVYTAKFRAMERLREILARLDED